MRRKKDRSNGSTALYERLSRDDDNAGESNSIVHQKQMLEDYAIKHGFTNLVHFTDDGWSGATFDRPSWNRLVEGVKNGEITACICKDIPNNHSEKNKPDGVFVIKQGKTNYKVKVFFDHSSGLTAEDRLKRIIQAEAERESA